MAEVDLDLDENGFVMWPEGRLEEAAASLGYNVPRSVWVFPDLRGPYSSLFPNK